jgi:hypothetical protein
MNEFINDGEIPTDIAGKIKRKSKSSPKVDRDLARGLNFNSDDLNSNRQGKISKRQGKMLVQKGESFRFHLFFTFCVEVLIFCSVIIFLGLIATKGNIPDDTSIIEVILTVFGTLAIFPGILGIPLYIEYREWKVIRVELKEGKIKAKKGKVILHPAGYLLTIGRSNFKLSYQAYLRFRHLDSYIIYYTPNSRIIFSAEPMEQ